MASSLHNFSTKVAEVPVPQSAKAVKGQKKNNAGGFSFTVTPLERAKRFIILGSDESFYVSGAKLTKQNANNLIKVAESEDSGALVDAIVEISTAGRAPKQDPGLFALAVASSFGSDDAKKYARSKVSEVARTASSLFTYIAFTQQFVGWGRGLRTTVANWYESKNTDALAYQVIKYREREGYTHKDVSSLSHFKFGTDMNDLAVRGKNTLIRYAQGKDVNLEFAPDVVRGFEAAKVAGADVPGLIRKFKLSWEMVPTESLNDVDVWDALLDAGVPVGALIRQLPRLTRIGVIKPLGGRTADIAARITDTPALLKARIHPLNLLIASKTYGAGRSVRGESTWTPNKKILDALNDAFYLSFAAVEPAGKRTLIGLDVSGSMGGGEVAGIVGLTPREATAAMSLVISATEPETFTIGFTGGYNYGKAYTGTRYGYRNGSSTTASGAVTELDISHKDGLNDVVAKVSNLPFGSTDCALPMIYALEKGLEVDTFLIMTDGDTWVGPIHPYKALEDYRKATGIPAKLVVMSTLASRFTIANPNDSGMLDIPGFDSAAPNLIASFSRGW